VSYFDQVLPLDPRVRCSRRVCIFQQKNAHVLNLESFNFSNPSIFNLNRENQTGTILVVNGIDNFFFLHSAQLRERESKNFNLAHACSKLLWCIFICELW